MSEQATFKPASFLSEAQLKEMHQIYLDSPSTPNKAFKEWLAKNEQKELRSALKKASIDEGYYLYAMEYVFQQS